MIYLLYQTGLVLKAESVCILSHPSMVLCCEMLAKHNLAINKMERGENAINWGTIHRWCKILSQSLCCRRNWKSFFSPFSLLLFSSKSFFPNKLNMPGSQTIGMFLHGEIRDFNIHSF